MMEFSRAKIAFLLKIACLLLICLCVSASSLAQRASGGNIAVSGIVKDNKNGPLIGVSVTVKGTTNAVMTDLDGKYMLKNVNPNAVLEVSYIGYKTVSTSVKNKSSIDIVMDENTQMLGEVVVEVGYNRVKRANLLGSVTSVSATDLEDIPVSNLSQTLTDRLPGVSVGTASGSPLATPSVTIRTSGSWNSEPPLYVIDGFIRDQDAFNLLDASQIESISILKDASAAVYGVRGAGGAILVTTKMGKSGKIKTSYSTDFGISDATQFPKLMSARQHATALNDKVRAYYNWDLSTVDLTSETSWFSDNELTALDKLNYNWLDDAWKSSIQTRHNLNFSGGSGNVRYFAAASYMYQDGNFQDLSMQKYSVRLGLEVDITKNLMAKGSLSSSNKNDHRPYNSADGSEFEKMYFTYATLLRQPKWKPAYIDGLPVGNEVTNHPYEVFNNGSYVKRRNNDNVMSLELQYQVPWLKGLKAGASFNYAKQDTYSKNISKPYTLYVFKTEGGLSDLNSHLLTNEVSRTTTIENNERIYEGSGFSSNYQLNATLNYSNKFGKHDVQGLLNFERSESNSNDMSITLEDLLIDNYELLGAYGRPASDGSIPSVVASDGMGNGGRQAYIGRFNYSYDSRYLLEATFRYEGSSMFSSSERWGFFPSVALGWRVSEESFFRDAVGKDLIEDMKLRVSYGRLGNDKGTSSSWDYFYTKTAGAYLGGTAVSTGLKPGNSGIQMIGVSWESTDSYNAGIDVSAFKNFTFSVDAFYKYTFNILQQRSSSLSYTTGITKDIPKENYGKQKAYGGEFSVTYRNRIGNDFKYSVGGYLSYASSKVVKKFVSASVVGSWQDENGRIRGGEAGYSSLGILRTVDEVQNYVNEYAKTGATEFKVFDTTISRDASGNVINPENYLGMLAFKDVGGASFSNEPDGTIDANDERIISKYDTPPFRYGFNLGFQWHGVRFDAVIGGQFGNKVLYDKAVYTTGEGNRGTMAWLSTNSNNLEMWADHYTPENPGASMPRLDKGYANKRSTFWMHDGHTLTLRSASVSYVVPQKFYSKIGLSALRVYLTGTNLLDIINPYPYKNASLSSWMDYPIMRTLNFGLNLTI